jgi:hypothetical protein
MTPHKSQRARKPITIWEEKKAHPTASNPKITEKTARNRLETALQPVAAGPLLEAIKLDELHLPDLSMNDPPLKLHYEPSESSATGLSKLQIFKRLFL